MPENETRQSIPPFQSIRQACQTTGLSQFYLRAGCRDGSVPCIRSGKKFLVDVPALLTKIHTEAAGSCIS